jgi:hypothetical protein
MNESANQEIHTGRCLCSAVKYRVRGPLRQVVACHCGQCQRTSGHFVAATQAYRADLTIEGESAITWYDSSPDVRRGFCAACGSQLFWERSQRDTVSIFAGSLDNPTGLKLVEHIFVADKADYYELTDGLPTRAQGGTEVPIEGR